MFDWSILCNVPSNDQVKQNLEVLFIGIMRSSLNKETTVTCSALFRNEITSYFINLIHAIPNSIYSNKLIFLFLFFELMANELKQSRKKSQLFQ